MSASGELIPAKKFQKTKRRTTLTAPECRFVEAIFSGKTGVEAYKLHISPDALHDTAKVAACRMRKRPELREYYRELQEDARGAMRARFDKILDHVCSIAMADRTVIFNDDGSIKPPREWPKDVRQAIDGIEMTETESQDADGNPKFRRRFVVRSGGAKLRALELLMQFLKMIGPGADLVPGGADNGIRIFTEPDIEPPAPDSEDDDVADDEEP